MKKVLVLCCMLWSVLTWAQVNVTFQVDMTSQTVSPNGVHVAGSFQSWNPASTALTNQGNGIYSVTLSIPAGTYQYKFINGNDWPQAESVPAACGVGDGFGGYNRTVNIGGNNPITVGPVCFASCFACNDQPGTVSVTLIVDMSEQTVSPNGVHVAGSFQGWNPSATAMTSIGNGLYSYTLELTENTSINYKFINGNDWPQAEVVPAECGVGDGFGGYNRTLSVQTADVPGSSVCFGSCAACATLPDPEMVQVTIRVDMSQQTVDPNGVHIVGTFQNWTLPGPVMSPAGNGVYEHIMEVTAGSTIDYKFLNGITFDVAESVPAECGVDDGFGGINRRLELSGLNDTTAATVCFSSCVACVLPETVMVTLQVDMSQQTVGANGVHVAGPFNDWSASATPMTDDNTDGVYTATIEVDANAQVFYKFINGDSWGNEEVLPAECSLSDGQGSFNRVIYTSQNDTIVPEVCFAQCQDCGIIIDEPSNLITFKVNMSQQTVSPQGVHIAGNFNGWNPASDELLDADNDGVYEVTLELDEWANLSFKFINGDTFDGAETVPSACGLPDGVGGNNRLLETGSNDYVFGPVCFSTCDICLPEVDPLFVSVTLLVNMQNETVSPNGVHVAGNFQGWDPAATAMTDANSDGIYEVTVEVEANSELQFKFINGNAWGENESVPAECGVTNDLNRSFEVLANDSIFGPVCFGACVDCEDIVEPTTVDVTFMVNMQNEIVDVNGVHLAGSIQGWNPASTEMTDEDNDGIYAVTLAAPINTEILFKFINGNAWSGEESVPMECGLSNGFGGYNRSFNVQDVAAQYGPVCYGECLDCLPAADSVQIAFRVDMTNEVVSGDGVFFTSPDVTSPAAMTSLGGGLYEYIGLFEIGQVVEYRFSNGAADEVVPAECAVDAGVNGQLREYTVGNFTQVVGPVCFASCDACPVVEPTLVTVVFQVNMSNEIVSPNGVHVAGSFQGWNPNGTVMNELGGGIYELSYQVESNQTIQFKFINGSTWDEQETVPADCGADNGFGGFNRSLEIGNENVVFGPVCFSGCVDCDEVVEPTTVEVTFQVDMSTQTVSPNGVHIAGNFQGWNPASSEMTDANSDGIYEYTASVPVNSNVLFKFINDNAWSGAETVPSDCGQGDGFGGYNRILAVNAADTVYGPVCFSQCVACGSGTPVLITFRVNMANETVSPDGVYIAGAFNGWDPTATQMSEYAPDQYEAVVVMLAGETAGYKFINGMDWTGAETVPTECGADDGGGNINRSYTAGEFNATVPVVCFSGCVDCVVSPEVDITFQVNMVEQVVEPAGVFVAGSFNGFNATSDEMNLNGGAIYSYTITVPTNTLVTYKFLNGANWETVPFECGQGDGFGGYNRYIQTGTTDIVIPIVCYNACQDCPDNISETSAAQWTMYPNPTRGAFQMSALDASSEVTLWNAQGQLVKRYRVTSATMTFELSNVAAGVYTVQHNGQSRRLVIE